MRELFWMWVGRRDFTNECLIAMFGKPKNKGGNGDVKRKLDMVDSGIALGLGLPPHIQKSKGGD